MKSDLWAFEREARKNGYAAVAGIDEAGRGPLAGPVVSAAVILPESLPVSGIRDSKKISPKNRERLFDEIHRHAIAVGVGVVSPADIDRMNILQASLWSMRLAVDHLGAVPDSLLIDGIFPISSDLPQQAIPKGDSRSISIAAASIVAKVTRDRIMDTYDRTYPEFEFSKNKGYPTPSHKAAIRRTGYCPIHRLTFKGVKEYCR